MLVGSYTLAKSSIVSYGFPAHGRLGGAQLAEHRPPARLVRNSSSPQGSATMGNPVVHFEIGCRDSQKTQDFYSSLFGWKIAQAGPAAMIDTGQGITGHISALGHEPFNYTIFYVEVEDVQAYLDKAAKLGAKTLVPPVPIPTGTFAWMQDPAGNTVGLWKPAAK
jgi:uncharacterized protein